MDQPYQLLIDIWEGNVNLDVPVLQSSGISGMVVRLNDMNGGHHMDARFAENWATAKQFAVQTVYFVYNPWVDGQANYTWLLTHLPSDLGGRRIMIDIEVTKADYSPGTYSLEVLRFLELVNRSHPTAIYTGGWFLDRLVRWPELQDYWWAAYSTPLTLCRTWEAWKAELEQCIDYQAFTRKAPGPARLWQATGDGCVLPGFGGHAVDVNVFPGTPEDLKNWLNIPSGGTSMGKWSSYARLKWIEQSAGTAVSLAGYDGAVIKLGDGHSMNTLSAQQLQAVHDAGKPAIGFYSWRFDYTYNMSFNQAAWPSAANDEYMKELSAAVMAGTAKRAYSGLIIDVTNTLQLAPATYLSDQWVRDFAFKHLAEMVYKAFGLPVWIYWTPAAHKPYKGSALTTYLAALPDGGKAVDQTLAVRNDSSFGADGYPADAASAVKDLNGNLVVDCGYWGLWLYKVNSAGLDWLYNGTPAQLAEQLGGSTPADPGTPGTTVDLSGVNAKLDQVLAGQAEILSMMKSIKALLERIFK